MQTGTKVLVLWESVSPPALDLVAGKLFYLSPVNCTATKML
jgi:hypothetical protein